MFVLSETLQQLHVSMYHEDAHVALAVSYWASRDYSRAEDEWRVACENTDTGCRHQGVNRTAVFPLYFVGTSSRHDATSHFELVFCMAGSIKTKTG